MRKNSGFSMVEVLVSLLVLGVGLLSLSGLQITSMLGSSNAHSRNVATLLAYEMSDRMRANQAGFEGGFYDNDITCSTADVKQCRTSYCTPEETAELDVQEVMCGVLKNSKREGGAVNLLVAGSMNIERNVGCADLTDPNKHRITLSWSAFKIMDEQQDSARIQSIQTCVIP